MSRQSNMRLTEVVVVVLVLALLIALAIPPISQKVKLLKCRNNLREFSAAWRPWLTDNDDKMPWHVSVTNGGAMEAVALGNVAFVFEVMSNELSSPKVLCCPADKRRIMATNFASMANSNISYFVTMDATETNPNMLALGDDHLVVDSVPVKTGILTLWTNSPVGWTAERHKKKGNVELMDGSVWSCSDTQLISHVRGAIVPTNRLVFP
ncbi:MAG: type II secretion system protein [Verrucomicrobiota bacterium]